MLEYVVHNVLTKTVIPQLKSINVVWVQSSHSSPNYKSDIAIALRAELNSLWPGDAW